MSTTDRSNSRREFLKKGLTGFTGASLLSTFGRSDETKKASDAKNKPTVIKRTLGRTGLKVPVISLGASNENVTRAALDAGVLLLDTANRYGAGRHETMLGDVLKGRPRNSFIIATKIIPKLDNFTGLPPENMTPADFKKDFRKKMEQSLTRLKLDFVDILYLHGVETPDTLKNQLIKDTMLELKEQGKARFLGTSFHHNEVVLIPATVDEKIYDVLLTTYNFRQPHWKEVRKQLAYATKAGLGTIGMKVMAGAFWDKERKFPINSKATIKWCLEDPNLHTTIPRVDNFEQLEINMSVMEDLSLTEIEKGDLKLGEKKALSGLYCAQCSKCRSQCSYNLEIPTVMRSYMYAYGYRKPSEARDTLKDLDRTVVSCRSCTNCAVTCTMGFDVSAKIRDVTRVLDVPGDFLA